MKTVEIPLVQLHEAVWNPNKMDEPTLGRLRESISRYGLVQNLVVRSLDKDLYEVLSGNQRLKVLKEAHFTLVPCVVVDIDDARARLLAQALNRIHSEDDLGLRAEIVRKVLDAIPESDVLALLPETAVSLRGLASMGQESVAAYLRNWQQAQSARLKHMQLQLTPRQLEVVEQAIARIMPQASQMQRDNPNTRGNALYLLCQYYLEKENGYEL